MFEKVVEAFEPFIIMLVLASGASLSGWVRFTNDRYVGYVVIFASTLLIGKNVIVRIKD